MNNATPATSAVAPLERTLVLCFDDTSDIVKENTNVFKMISLLRNDGPQKVYYQPDLGPDIEPGYNWPSTIRPTVQSILRIVDHAFAWSLRQRVMGGYEWLVQHYSPGDKVCLLGFSRGAYAARVLAAMLHKVGLVSHDKLNNQNEILMILDKISLAYDLYMSTGTMFEFFASEFKYQYCFPICIDFLGVWDTVASMGFLSQTLPVVDLNGSVRVFRQALSLDEHRARFRPTLFRPKSLELSEGEDFQTDVREVWFPGSHSDVGGSRSMGTCGPDLANISLRWMIEQLVRSRCQILFRYERFARRNIPTTIGQDQPLSPPQGVPSASEDVDVLNAQDAIQPINDKLSENPLWWILEVLPTSYTFQSTQGKWVSTFEPNFGRGRRIPPGSLFHTTVKTRMDDPSLAYKPRAWYEHGTEEYVSY